MAADRARAWGIGAGILVHAPAHDRPSGLMPVFGKYAITCALIIAGVGTVGWLVAAPSGKPMVVASAALAFAVQLLAFGVARLLQRSHNLMIGWGLGSLLRLVVLVLYAVVVARLLRAPIAPALLSFAAFLFATTIVEPLFLKR